jgi:hypothetical protein
VTQRIEIHWLTGSSRRPRWRSHRDLVGRRDRRADVGANSAAPQERRLDIALASMCISHADTTLEQLPMHRCGVDAKLCADLGQRLSGFIEPNGLADLPATQP